MTIRNFSNTNVFFSLSSKFYLRFIGMWATAVISCDSGYKNGEANQNFTLHVGFGSVSIAE